MGNDKKKPYVKKGKYPPKDYKTIDLNYGTLSESFTLKDLFPVHFVCKNYKCDAEFTAVNFTQYEGFKKDRQCVCGWKLFQFVLSEESES